MNVPLPFGLPFPTQLYLMLYLSTWILHVLLMNYVLAGAAYLAVLGTLGGEGVERPLARVMRDWMPFALSAAITAGVAPLLFVQIVYREAFYTGNLLLFPRWLGIIPALIVGFYLLYVWKVKSIGRWPAWLRVAVGWVTLATFVFTAWSWTENHLISSSPAEWPGIYAETVPHGPLGETALRLFIWLAGALGPMAVIAGWQLRYLHEHRAAGYAPADLNADAPHLARLAIAGIGLECLAALVYLFVLESSARDMLLGMAAGPYVFLAAAGAALAIFGWWKILAAGAWEFRPLAMASAGTLALLTGIAFAREGVRISRLDLAKLYDYHSDTWQIGGFGVFVAFALVNTGLMVWCVLIVRRAILRTPASEKEAERDA